MLCTYTTQPYLTTLMAQPQNKQQPPCEGVPISQGKWPNVRGILVGAVTASHFYEHSSLLMAYSRKRIKVHSTNHSGKHWRNFANIAKNRDFSSLAKFR